MFRGSELPRLMTMVVLLGVLGLLVVRARDPATWKWFAEDGQQEKTAAAPSPPAEAGEKAGQEAPAAAPAAAPVATGPTDEDPEQRAEAGEEFQAVTDGTLGIQPEEMLAYWRLFHWVEHQSFQTLRQGARGLVFNDLMQSPEEYRGRLVRVDLNVRRVLAYDAEQSPLDEKRFYEIWGWSDESKVWLYCVVTAHLPEGMPIGAEVYERASFAGYFFKLQGYYEAGAKPRAAALRAPLLVGRLIRYPSQSEAATADQGGWIMWAAGAALAVFALALVLGGLGRRGWRRRRADHEQQRGLAVRQWLDEDFLPPGAQPAPEEDAIETDWSGPAARNQVTVPNANPSSNGHGKHTEKSK